MTGRTDFAGLTTVGPGESLSEDGYRFTSADRHTIDMLLRLLFNHQHNGESVTPEVPTVGVDLTVDPTGGHLAPGTLYYYKHTLVSPEGIETEAGPETTAMTPAQVSTPDPPALQRGSASGDLHPGNYVYVLSAYRGSDTLETIGSTPVTGFLPSSGGNTQRVILTLPTLPLGADGFNVYRRIPNGAGLLFIDTIDMTVVDPPETWIDDGSLVGNLERRAPAANTTSSENSILVEYPSDDPVPVGYTWRIYRTDTNGDWDDSLLHHVVEETSEGSGIITTEYLDVGDGTLEGSPPDHTINFTWPDPINFDEVGGEVVANRVNSFPATVEFHRPGAVAVAEGPQVWICPYELCSIREIRLVLGWRDGPNMMSVPDTTDLEIDVRVSWNDGVSFTSITNDVTPTILAGENQGIGFTPDASTGPTIDDHPETLVRGDMVRIDVTQAGGGANTDENLTVILYLAVREADSVALVWPTP